MSRSSALRQAPKAQTFLADQSSGPHPVDKEVGRRIRLRRQQLRLSQTALGAGIGLSFQQVQKYERGLNRVSISVLYQIANVLDVPMAYFFDTLPHPNDGRCDILEQKAETRCAYVATEEGQRLVDSFLRLPKQVRPKMIAMLNTLGASCETTSET
ncbi:helix-turn-helix domain-containing protein [Neorhizobium sp. NCHU2750]|uniref:helix-turn-helix domain-containing protein n=1 Tax=Neorhizobium sp. NCHU2750 TaxID=1825976 RepID=UPI000E74A26A|nr:transcriptional regulator [Neorhizobium sp. NCHU2750]